MVKRSILAAAPALSLVLVLACDSESEEEDHPHLDAADTICTAIDDCYRSLDEDTREGMKQQCILSYLDLFDQLGAQYGPACADATADIYRCSGAGGTCDSISEADCSEQTAAYEQACGDIEQPMP